MTSDPRSRKRPLTAEEAELWQHATRHAKALRRRERQRVKASLAENEPETLPAALVQDVSADEQGASLPTGLSRNAAPKSVVAPVPSSPPPLASFDERQRRKLAKDSELIDARLDLHGMRQGEAHVTLRGFLRSCAARGMRHVLVITGKGTVTEGTRSRDFYQEERGVLRRLVPQWLAGADLRDVVISYTAAHIRHGGDGALYVRLRKRAARK